MLCVQVMLDEFFLLSLTLLRICDNVKSFGWSCSEPAPSKFRFQRSWHVSTQKSNTNLGYFTFNQSIKLKFSLYRAIWVCFTWIAHCTPHPLPTITYSHPSPPSIGSLCLRKDFWDRHKANIATRWKDVCERLFWRPKKQFWREIIAFYQ